MSPTPLPPSLQRHLASELMPGERVLWAGTPRPWPALLIRLPLALLGLWLAMMAAPWVSFFVAHALGLVEPGRDGGTPRLVSVVASLFLLPFAAGLAGLILSPLLAALSALVTVRAVTDRRVLGLRGGLFPKAESLPATRVTGASQVRVGPFTWLRIEIEGGGRERLSRVYLGLPAAEAAVQAVDVMRQQASSSSAARDVAVAAGEAVAGENRTALPPSLARRLHAALDPGERVTAAAMPGLARTLRPMLPLAAFGLVWTMAALAFCIIGAVSLWRTLGGEPVGVPVGVALFAFALGALFCLVGLALVSTPFMALWQGAVTVHAVTDRRLLTVRGRPFAGVEALAPDQVKRVERRDHGDGRGTLVLGLGIRIDSDGDRGEATTIWHGLREPRAIEAAIARLIPATRDAPPA